MKLALKYGGGASLAAFAIGLILFLAGYHSDPEKLGVAQTVGIVAGLGLTIASQILGVKARRSDVPAHEEFGYGQALGTATLIALVGAFIGAALQVIYIAVINPGFTDVVVAAQIAKMEAANMPAENIAGAETMIRKMSGPAAQGVFGFIGGFATSFVIALIVSAFLKRPATAEPPAL